MSENQTIPEVVVIGGGFGGLTAARCLDRTRVNITLIDRRNFHLFQPLLYQVATGGLSPGNIAAPLRALLSRQKNARVLLAEAVGIDSHARKVQLSDGKSLSYDMLVVASGVRHSYFDHPEWEKAASGLKSIEDATNIRRSILLAFETAEFNGTSDTIQQKLTFIVIGGGPTGVELAGTIAELARWTLRRNFRRIDPSRARIVLIENADRVLPTYPADLSDEAERSLLRLGVEVWVSAKVTEIRKGAVTVNRGNDLHTLHAENILWAAGVQASPLGKTLAGASGAEFDAAGRVIVRPDLSIGSHPEIFVIGDLAHFKDPSGKPLPGIAPVAIQQGQHVAQMIARRLRGETTWPFRFRDKGMMATIGRAAAVGVVFGFHVSGWFAWLMWLFIHLMYLVVFENRVLVFLQWAWNYFTRNRSARLITGGESDGLV